MKNKKGAFTDIFLFIIVAFVLLVISGIMIYIGALARDRLHTEMDDMVFSEDTNTTEVIDDTMGEVATSYRLLYWISIFIIVGMMLSILVGSYLVTTRPIFFVPYFLLLIIAVFVSVGISNAYERIIADPTLASTFEGFIGSNFIMANLPLWVSVIGIIGAIIMFGRLGSRERGMYYG